MKRKGAGAHNPSRIYELFRRPYVYSVLVIFILYLAIVFIIGNFPTTIPLALLYAPLQTRIELLLSLLFSITIAALVACNVVLAYLKYQEQKKCHAASAVTSGDAWWIRCWSLSSLYFRVTSNHLWFLRGFVYICSLAFQGT